MKFAIAIALVATLAASACSLWEQPRKVVKRDFGERTVINENHK